MKMKNKSLNALVYLFDDIICENLGLSMEEYNRVIDSMSYDDADFVVASVFEWIVTSESGQKTDDIQRDYDEACHMFLTQREIILKNNDK